MSEPAYLALHAKGGLKLRAEDAVRRLTACQLCPRNCGVNRLAGERGFCRTGRLARIASCHAHHGEEAAISGISGSGALFFSSCNLLCAFCQNFDISHGNEGRDVQAEEAAAMMLALARHGCHNINCVTPSHVVPQILEALVLAADHGLDVPLVYNSSGYDSVETLGLLDGVFNIYMPDFKFWDNAYAERYCRAPDYRETAVAALREMHRQVGDLTLDERGIATRGLLVRHLVMPNGIAGTAEIMRFLAQEISPATYVNIMAQYHPCGTAGGDGLVNRRIRDAEFRAAVQAARQTGLSRLDR